MDITLDNNDNDTTEHNGKPLVIDGHPIVSHGINERIPSLIRKNKFCLNLLPTKIEKILEKNICSKTILRNYKQEMGMMPGDRNKIVTQITECLMAKYEWHN